MPSYSPCRNPAPWSPRVTSHEGRSARLVEIGRIRRAFAVGVVEALRSEVRCVLKALNQGAPYGECSQWETSSVDAGVRKVGEPGPGTIVLCLMLSCVNPP